MRRPIYIACFGIVIFILFLFPRNFVASKEYNYAVFSIGNQPDVSPALVIDILPNIVRNDRVAKAGLLYDLKKNKIVWAKEMDKTFAIASLSKMMTVLLVMEDLKSGKITWNSSVCASKEAELISATKINVKNGEPYTIEELVKSSLISSANDACYMLACCCSGTGNERDFVQRMNQKAHQLNMNNTFFSNSTGLPAPHHVINNYSSPSDLLILAKELLKYPEITDITCRDAECLRTGVQKIPLRNHNRLVAEYLEVDGLKTGYTQKAGFCIVATSKRDNQRLISIVLGVQSQPLRNSLVAEMFNNYYANVLGVGRLGENVK